MTLERYAQQLGTDQERLKQHCKKIDGLVEQMKVGKVNWDIVEPQSDLHGVSKVEQVEKEPGATWCPLWYYQQQHGTQVPDANLGHRPFTRNGVAGVLIPDAPVVRMEFNRHHGAEVRQKLGSTDEGMTAAALEKDREEKNAYQ
eukprot:6492065-Amphidinium_carterae.1